MLCGLGIRAVSAVAETAKGWDSPSSLRLQTKGCQTQGIAVAVKSGGRKEWSQRETARGRKGTGLGLGARRAGEQA